MLEINNIARFLNFVMKYREGDALPSPKRLPSARLLEAGPRAGRCKAFSIPLPDLLVLGQFFHTFSVSGGFGDLAGMLEKLYRATSSWTLPRSNSSYKAG